MTYRYKITFEYDGTGIAGWQKQPHMPSIQQFAEEALAKFTKEQPELYCAGRTDAGVHALGQICHFDLSREWDCFRILEAMNFWLRKKPVSVLAVEQVDESFHARFSAKGRRYMYRIINRRAPLVIDLGRAWHVLAPLDVATMHKAAQHLVGHYDFTTFRATECQGKSPWKTLEQLDVVRVSEEEIHVHTRSKSFLHHQVRNMVGSLSMVGSGKWSVEDFIAARDALDRTKGGPTAPACGLYFMEVFY